MRFISIIMLIFVFTSNCYAVCKGKILNPITDICWQCIFPIKIYGVCSCPFPPPVYRRVGITVSFWEPARFVETVKDPYCFPSIGKQLSHSSSSRSPILGGGSSDQGTDQGDPSSFAQAHYFIFPVWSIMGLFTDYACVENGGMDIAYITEVDPLWNNDSLAFIINPEALLFANPIAQLSCIADSVSSNLGRPIDALFWCIGSGGSVYPLTGHVNDDNLVQANNDIAERMIYKLGREGLLWDMAVYYCSGVPTPIWIKSHYKLQIVKPVRGFQCIPIGRSSLIWGIAKNPPTYIGDNFLWMIFRKRWCCAY